MIGFPFDSVVSFDEHGYPIFDRAVSSKPLKALIGKLFTTGVMPNPSNNLQVFANEEGMTVTVKAGFCVIEGGLKLEDTDRTLEIQASNTTYDRIDTVVMRWNGNDNARICDLYVVAGTPTANPTRPELTRTGSIYEIGLADIFIPANTGAITQQRITDTRYESERCGVVSSVSEWDTTTIYTQVQADLANFQDVEEADFLEWYETIKDRIDAITAEMLQDQIDTLDSGKADKVESATEGNFAALDSNGNLTDSGHKHSDYITDISGKADKVSGATNNNFAALDSNGNLKDSGKKASDFQTALNLSSATATGNPLSFNTDSEGLAKNTVITLNPIQSGSGDPSPSNVRAISGYDEIDLAVTHKNMFDIKKLITTGITYSDGVFSGTALTIANLGKLPFYNPSNAQITISFKAKTDGSGSTEGNGITLRINYTDGTRSSVACPNTTSDYTAFSVTSDPSKSFANIEWTYGAYASRNNVWYVKDFQIELGSTATAYEPYNPLTDISILLDETVYGGTLDVESGVLNVTHKYITLDGSESYGRDDSGASEYFAAYTDTLDVLLRGNSGGRCICDKGIGALDYSTSQVTVRCGKSQSQSRIYLSVPTSVATITSLTELANWISANNLNIVYPLATPIIYHLTPHQVKLLQGANVVTSNGTSISLTYRNGNVMTLADIEGLADSIEALNKTWVYDDYVVKGDGTTTWRDLLQLLQPIYNGLTDQEKTYSKIIVRADDPNSNECLTFVGAYWYARDTFTSDGLWGSRVSLEGSCSRSTYMSGSFSDGSTTATSVALALRVLRAQENATQIITSSRSVSNENTRSLPVEENLTKSDTLKTDELNEINKIDAEDVKNDN